MALPEELNKCEYCGKEFLRLRVRQKTCGTYCSQKLYKKRLSEVTKQFKIDNGIKKKKLGRPKKGEVRKKSKPQKPKKSVIGVLYVWSLGNKL